MKRSEAGVDYLWHTQTANLNAAVTRSFGWTLKNDFTLTGVAEKKRFRLPDDASRSDPAARAEFEREVLPKSDTRIAPGLEWRTYTSSFLRTHDLETLGLQEDYRLGHDVVLRAALSEKTFGSSRSYVSLFAGAQYTLALGNGFVRGAASWAEDVSPERVWDASVTVAVRISTPRASSDGGSRRSTAARHSGL